MVEPLRRDHATCILKFCCIKCSFYLQLAARMAILRPCNETSISSSICSYRCGVSPSLSPQRKGLCAVCIINRASKSINVIKWYPPTDLRSHWYTNIRSANISRTTFGHRWRGVKCWTRRETWRESKLWDLRTWLQGITGTMDEFSSY